MKKLICILRAAATAAGCEKDDPTRYDMSQGRVCFPGAAPNETAEYPGYSNSDSTFYASMTFKQQPEGVAEAVIEVPVKLIGGASGSDRKIGVRVLEEGTTAQPGQYEILGAEVPAGKTYGAIRIEVAKSAELDTQQRELTLCLTDSPDLRVGPDLYLKANVSWHNMLPRPATTKQWSTYNAFIESEASSGSSSTEAYSQAGAPAAKLIYDIPAEANALIAEAVSFVFSRFDPILYIATRSAIYKVIFTTGSVNFDPAPVFTAPAGEHITLARLYLQGYYAMENYDGSSTLPSNASLAWSSRAVTVVTSKDDGNDKIHVVPQINFGSGQLDQPNALVFDGFGKILDFTVAGLYK